VQNSVHAESQNPDIPGHDTWNVRTERIMTDVEAGEVTKTEQWRRQDCELVVIKSQFLQVVKVADLLRRHYQPVVVQLQPDKMSSLGQADWYNGDVEMT